jgi:hypothetical protein
VLSSAATFPGSRRRGSSQSSTTGFAHCFRVLTVSLSDYGRDVLVEDVAAP